MDFALINLIFRICYPIWGGKAIEHDPTGIAFFKPIFAFPDFIGGISEGGQPFPTVWIVAAVVLVVFVIAGLLAYFAKIKMRRTVDKA